MYGVRQSPNDRVQFWDLGETTESCAYGIEPDHPDAHLQMFGAVPAPVKLAFRQGILRILREQPPEKRCNCSIPSGHKKGPSIWEMTNMDNFPDVTVGFGPDAMCDGRFHENAIASGLFADPRVDSLFHQDTLSQGTAQDALFYVYAVSPYVLLVDLRKLNGAAVPSRWSDLLHDAYRHNLVMESGVHGMVSSVILYHFYREHGDAGIRRLAKNTAALWSPAKIIWEAQKPGGSHYAIHIVPWFFAKCCPDTEHFRIVWPYEGALFYPLFVVAKKQLSFQARAVLDFITGAAFGRQCARNYCPPPGMRLSETQSYYPPTFECMRKYDLKEKRKDLARLFGSSFVKDAY